MTSVRRRPLKVVTDSEDDQSDSRQRRNLHITSKRVSTIAEEKHDETKKKIVYDGFSHTLPIHTLSKASVLSKEAPPENYSGFLRLGSKLNLWLSW
jgi:diacylglycerol O-acyltransferase-1